MNVGRSWLLQSELEPIALTDHSRKKKGKKKEVTWYYKRYVLELRVAFAVAI